MNIPTLNGILPPFPTPVTTDGKVDEAALRKLVEYLVQAGCRGLVPIGGTGEYTALAPADRERVVAITVEVAAGRVPVVAGMVSPGFAEAVEAGKAFRACGADALLTVTPFYVSPSQQGIRDYFRAYRDAVDMPILFYDIPYRTRIVTDVSTIVQMELDGSIFGMKACNTDMAHFNEIAALTTADFQLLSGEDMLFPAQIALGARGGILASSPLIPEYWVELQHLLDRGEMQQAIAAHRELLPLLKALFLEANPGPLKTAMKWMGHDCGAVLAPLQAPTEVTMERMRQAIEILAQKALIKGSAHTF